MSNISLVVADAQYSQWKDMRVDRSMAALSGSFTFIAADYYIGRPAEWGIKLGDTCEVKINAHTLLTGYIDDVNGRFDKQAHALTVVGRDTVSDLVDCTYDEDAAEWRDITLAQVIKRLCSPYSITVVVDSSVTSDAQTRVEKVVASPGDTVFDVISRHCRAKAIQPVSYGDGTLVLTRATTTERAHDMLEVGVNVKSGGMAQSNRDRFSEYTVKGQGATALSLPLAGSMQPASTPALDNVIGRHRPLTILLEGAADEDTCNKRARWEARMRAARSRSYMYNVRDWLQSNGVPWSINTLVTVNDDKFNDVVNKELLIVSTVFTLNEANGTMTSLTVADPTAYSLIEEPIQDVAGPFDLLPGID